MSAGRLAVMGAAVGQIGDLDTPMGRAWAEYETAVRSSPYSELGGGPLGPTWVAPLADGFGVTSKWADDQRLPRVCRNSPTYSDFRSASVGVAVVRIDGAHIWTTLDSYYRSRLESAERYLGLAPSSEPICARCVDALDRRAAQERLGDSMLKTCRRCEAAFVISNSTDWRRLCPGCLTAHNAEREERKVASEVEKAARAARREAREAEKYREPRRRSGEPPEPTSLYRFFDRDGALLYVGITSNPSSRFRQHAESAKWWKSARRVSVETFPSRVKAAAAEAWAIDREAPAWNVIRPTPPMRRPKPSSPAPIEFRV